jgi:D-apionolactonase
MPHTASDKSLDEQKLVELFGTTQDVTSPILLVAGDLSCLLEEGAIRTVCWRGVEIIRGISYLLRDRNWGTAPAHVTMHSMEQGSEEFRVEFGMHMELPEGGLDAIANISGRSNGEFVFNVVAQTKIELKTNRCGFVVLHPSSAAGVDLEIGHTDGSLEHTQFPKYISPGQVAFSIKRLKHTPVPGLQVDCQLSADLPHDPLGKFEMEDQRNWSDASFKTYVASLLDPWPYALQPGKTYSQEVKIQVLDSRQPVHRGSLGSKGERQIIVGDSLDTAVPEMGVGVPLKLSGISKEEYSAVIGLQPSWLVAELDLDDLDSAAAQLAAIRQLANDCGAKVQLDVITRHLDNPNGDAERLAQLCMKVDFWPQALRACPAAYFKSYQPTDKWPEGCTLEQFAEAFATRFPAARIGGGMLTYFTELNRKRQGADHIQFIGHSTCPLVHAADDESVMQSTESLESIVSSVRNIWPGLGYRLGPITIGMQRNPYGARITSNPARIRTTMAQDDPRHQATFGAAWLVKYASAVIDQHLELLSFNHSHGVSGPISYGRVGDIQDSLCNPAWRVQTELCKAIGCRLLAIKPASESVSAIGWTDVSGRRQILIANTTPIEEPFALSGSWRFEDLSTPKSLRAHRESSSVGERLDNLHPYQVMLATEFRS